MTTPYLVLLFYFVNGFITRNESCVALASTLSRVYSILESSFDDLKIVEDDYFDGQILGVPTSNFVLFQI